MPDVLLSKSTTFIYEQICFSELRVPLNLFDVKKPYDIFIICIKHKQSGPSCSLPSSPGMEVLCVLKILEHFEHAEALHPEGLLLFQTDGAKDDRDIRKRDQAL